MFYGNDKPGAPKKKEHQSFGAQYVDKPKGHQSFGGQYANDEAGKDATMALPGVDVSGVGQEDMAAPKGQPEVKPSLHVIPGGKATKAGLYSRDMEPGNFAPGVGPNAEPMEKKSEPTVGPGGEVEPGNLNIGAGSKEELMAGDPQEIGSVQGEREFLAEMQGMGVDPQLDALEAQKQAGLANLKAEEAQGLQDLAQAMNEAGIGVSGAFGAGKEGYTTASALAQAGFGADVEVQKQMLALDWQVKQLETQLSVWGDTLDAQTKQSIQDKINALNQSKLDLETKAAAQAEYESASDVMQTFAANAFVDWTGDMQDEVKWPVYELQGQLLHAAQQEGGPTYQEAQSIFEEFIGKLMAAYEKDGSLSLDDWAQVSQWLDGLGLGLSLTPPEGVAEEAESGKTKEEKDAEAAAEAAAAAASGDWSWSPF